MAAMTRVCFRGGSIGEWRVLRMQTLAGPPLEPVASLNRQKRPGPAADGAVWSLHGVTSHQRYVYGREKLQLEAVQAGLGRPEATRAALIPITKSAVWWDLPQDERRAIFEERSYHISASLKYLPRSHGGFTTHASSAGRSISSHGSSSRPSTQASSMSWSPCCAERRSGVTSSARWISGSDARADRRAVEAPGGAPR